MLSKIRPGVACVLLGALLTLASMSLNVLMFAQTTAPRSGFQTDDNRAPTEGLARQENYEPQNGLQPCQLVFCTNDLSKVLVYAGSDTAPVHNARSVVVSVDRISAQPKVTCKLYAGVFEPTEPETKTWVVTEVRLVDPAQFQKLVDSNEQSLRDLLRVQAQQVKDETVEPTPEEAAEAKPVPGQPQANTSDSVPLAPRSKFKTQP